MMVALGLCASGCQTASYYAQAVRGQHQIWIRQRPVTGLLVQTSTPPVLKEKLRLALALRAFAEKELRLPANGHYLAYADLGRRYAVWDVYATPRYSMEAKSWWYPIVGRLKYRGYFSEARARRYAAQLEREGFDVYVGGVAAYSTLGWFHDPLLNTFIHDSETDLAELLFHELAHQRLFVAGETEFNEAFATAVAEEGLRRWLAAQGDPEASRKYQAELQRHLQFMALISDARGRLEKIYASVASPAEKEQRKREVARQMREDYATLRAGWGNREDYDRWFAQSLNNAQLNTVETYYELVPAFRAILAAKGGDLEAFLKEATRLARLKASKRSAALESWSPAGAARR